MLSTAHVLVGAALGSVTGDVYLAALAGLLSHHVMDLVPHWDPGSWHYPNKQFKWTKRDWQVAIIDNIIFVLIWLLLLGLFWGQPLMWPVLVGGFMAVFPDIWHHIPLWKNFTRRFTKSWFGFHQSVHSTVPANNWVLGVFTQVFISVTSIIVIISMKW